MMVHRITSIVKRTSVVPTIVDVVPTTIVDVIEPPPTTFVDVVEEPAVVVFDDEQIAPHVTVTPSFEDGSTITFDVHVPYTLNNEGIEAFFDPNTQSLVLEGNWVIGEEPVHINGVFTRRVSRQVFHREFPLPCAVTPRDIHTHWNHTNNIVSVTVALPILVEEEEPPFSVVEVLPAPIVVA